MIAHAFEHWGQTLENVGKGSLLEKTPSTNSIITNNKNVILDKRKQKTNKTSIIEINKFNCRPSK